MGTKLRDANGLRSFEKTQDKDWTSAVVLDCIGQQIIDLDVLGSDITIDISEITITDSGYYALSVIGSDTYSCQFSPILLSAIVSPSTDIIAPTLVQGKGSRNNLFFFWNAGELNSTIIKERLIAITNTQGKATQPPASPLLIDARGVKTAPDTLELEYDRVVTITDITDITLTTDDATPINVTAYISGNNTKILLFQLDRSTVLTETITCTIGASNTIVAVNGNIPYIGITNFPVINNTINWVTQYTLNFVSSATPFASVVSGAGNVLTFDNGVTMISTGVAASYAHMFATVTGILNAGDHVRFRFINLVINSGALPVRTFAGTTESSSELISTSGSEVIYEIGAFPALNASTLSIGDNSTTDYDFDLTCAQIIIEKEVI